MAPGVEIPVGQCSATRPHFILLGSTGFLGAAILRTLEGAGLQVVQSRIRLQDRIGIERLLDECTPSLGVICAAGERGRPDISWCDQHPVETLDANLIGQLNVATACYFRGLHATLIGTGAMYQAETPGNPTSSARRFSESDPSNIPQPGTYVALRQKLEDVAGYFDNVLLLRVMYPVSADLDPRGLIGKLAGFRFVNPVTTSVTVLEDLCPLIPELVRRRITGPLNFVNRGTVSYVHIVEELQKLAPNNWRSPTVSSYSTTRPSAELDVGKFEESLGVSLPSATESVKRIIERLNAAQFADLIPASSNRSRSPL